MAAKYPGIVIRLDAWPEDRHWSQDWRLMARIRDELKEARLPRTVQAEWTRQALRTRSPDLLALARTWVTVEVGVAGDRG